MPETSGFSRGAWIETLFDPSHPNLFLITLPTLVLFALGIRRGAAIYLFLALGFMFLRSGI
ncbi:MAG: hypothetical protein AAFR44_05795 [Pseudomonadota bacterium]